MTSQLMCIKVMTSRDGMGWPMCFYEMYCDAFCSRRKQFAAIPFAAVVVKTNEINTLHSLISVVPSSLTDGVIMD